MRWTTFWRTQVDRFCSACTGANVPESGNTPYGNVSGFYLWNNATPGSSADGYSRLLERGPVSCDGRGSRASDLGHDADRLWRGRHGVASPPHAVASAGCLKQREVMVPLAVIPSLNIMKTAILAQRCSGGGWKRPPFLCRCEVARAARERTANVRFPPIPDINSVAAWRRFLPSSMCVPFLKATVSTDHFAADD